MNMTSTAAQRKEFKKDNKKRIVPSILTQRVTRQGVESYLGDR